MRRCIGLLAPAILLAVAVSAQFSPSNIDGPWNRDLKVMRSTNGSVFSAAATFIERAGVPCLVRDRDGLLIAVFQWFPFDDRASFDRVAVSFSADDGATWSAPKRITVRGLPDGYQRPFDPTIVPLPDGRFRLFFTSNHPGHRRQGIYSAVSVDAQTFDFEPGLRSDSRVAVVDASAVHWRNRWHMFAHYQSEGSGPPRNHIGYHAVSEDGLNFEKVADVTAPQGAQWIGNPVVVGELLRFYGGGRNGLWSGVSRDGASWTPETTVLPRGGDPSAVRCSSGEWLLVYVSDLRTDASTPPWMESQEPANSGPPPSRRSQQPIYDYRPADRPPYGSPPPPGPPQNRGTW